MKKIIWGKVKSFLLQQALGLVLKELKKDQSPGSLHDTWKSNIAGSIVDTVGQHVEQAEGSPLRGAKMWDKAKESADSFLNKLTK